jgi:glycogen synthase
MSAPRRVLMTADTVGGVFTYALALSAELADRGIGIDLATMGGPLSPSQREEAATNALLTVHERPYRLEWMEDPWEDVARAGEWLLELAMATSPDVVHVNGYAHAALPFGVPVVVTAHSCVVSWWQAVHGERPPAEYARYGAEVRKGIDASSVVVAPTRAMLEALVDAHGPVAAWRVIHNGIDDSRFAPGRKSLFVFGAGRVWDEAKNLRALARIAPELPIPVVVAGDARAPGGPPRRLPSVHATGVLGRAELRRWLSEAPIFALPALYEPFGLGVLEAALSGCALVLGDIPSLRELWGDAAFYVAPRRPEELRDALLLLAEDEPLRTELSRRAVERARRFTATAMGDAYVALYGEVLSHGSRRPSARTQRRSACA